jgi:hypothetical protein
VLKSLHEILLKDIILLDATKRADSLKRYWFIPLWFDRKKLEGLIKQVFDLIGGQSVDDLQNDFDKLLSYRRLQLLEALYKAVNIEIGLKARINAWKIILEKDYKDSEQLQKILEEVKIHTGIEINTPENLKEFEQYVQHKIDKHRELYPEIEKTEVNLTKVIYSVFNFMGEPYNENMRLITFVELKAMAEDRVRQSKTSEDNG